MTPRSRPSSADQPSRMLSFKPITPLSKVKGESRRILPKPPSSTEPAHKTQQELTGYDSTCSNTSSHTDKASYAIFSNESMEVLNISKSVGAHDGDFYGMNDQYYDYPCAYDQVYDDQVFANAQDDDGIIYDDDVPAASPEAIEMKSTETLKKIINDLCDAANKPIHYSSSGSQYNSGSSTHDNSANQITHRVAFSPQDSSAMDACDNRLCRGSHPALHRILKYCDLVTSSIQKNDLPCFGMKLFQSAFTYRDYSHQVNEHMFRTPSGRKPVISQVPSAFVPVNPSAHQDNPELLSIVAIDSVHQSITCSQPLQEGDYLIEVGK